MLLYTVHSNRNPKRGFHPERYSYKMGFPPKMGNGHCVGFVGLKKGKKEEWIKH